MLSIYSDDHLINRRAMLTVGSLSGLCLADLLAAKALAGTGEKPITTGKSVVFLLQHGGPTQFETFDPKVDVPDGIRTVGGVTQTAVPGITFGATMEKLAPLADRLTIVRSYSTGSSGHSIRPLISNESRDANIGSLYSRLAGTNHPVTGMPTNITLFPNSVVPDEQGPDERFGKFSQTGSLPKSYEPFAPGGGSALQKNLQLVLPRDRFDDRRNLLASLDRIRRQLDSAGHMEGVDKFREQAMDMVLRGVADAFDLSQEDPRTLARYDTSGYVHETRYNDKSNGKQSRRWYQTNANTLGKQLLLARRLCERGCGFVTVATRFVWDMHADTNNLGVERGMEAVGRPFDHAVSAFIEDCKARGLSDDIMLVTAGEMGRTPKINNRGGRDHWGRLAPLMISGGGTQSGTIIGRSTRDGGQPDAVPVDSNNLIASIMHTLFDIGELRIRQGLPTGLARFVSSGEPIPGLL